MRPSGVQEEIYLAWSTAESKQILLTSFIPQAQIEIRIFTLP